ncbi:MAG: UDP-N-acetylmuramoyl-L-alanine--D-glutamate ligase [Treponema sp.]|jgi:UDP-N-acetylmuramoylalanine--D-glutamate ligase|nr:UDP-N-acetylmuramoyl-L-alanine--D-glutamate ligase [Treponema sp.]
MNYSGIKVLVMGLGLHGGGLATARFLLSRGASITVTDMRDEKRLKQSIEELDAACSKMGAEPVQYILGRHEIADFQKADIVIKNPGVKPNSPFLQYAKCIKTDISLFLPESPARLFAVTGTKGKSGTSAALHWILSQNRKKGRIFLGGNITVSPLTFLDELTENDDVVLELSSFQLGDIKNYKMQDGSLLLKPAVAVLTTIMEDHLDRYTSMKEYIDDKRNIYRGQDSSCITIGGDDEWGRSFRAETKGRPLVWSRQALGKDTSGGWLNSSGAGFARLLNWEGQPEEIAELVPLHVLTPGVHQKLNMLCAALAAYSSGVKAQTIHEALGTYTGIEHRLEFFHKVKNIRFFNDSAATIPEAAIACIDALSQEGHLILVTGGTDKNLDFTSLAKSCKKVKALILLAGTGSDKLKPLLDKEGIPYSGPFNELDEAVRTAVKKAKDGGFVALSPGCASFGMFLNEFDRGRKWKEAVLRLS